MAKITDGTQASQWKGTNNTMKTKEKETPNFDNISPCGQY